MNTYKEYGLNEDLLVKTIKGDRVKIYEEIISTIDKLDKDYKRLLNKIFKDNENRILNIPSSTNAYKERGGYIKQISNVICLNKKIFPLYKNLDINLIVSGIIIKNIGLINYFNDDMIHSVSDKNENLGFRLLGINIINDYCNQYAKFPTHVKTELQNIVLSEDFSNEIHINYINSIYNFEHSVYSSINEN